METLNIVQDVVITGPKKRGRPRKGMEKPKVVDEDPKPRKLGRPLQEWRHNPDGTYNSKAIDPKYSLKYWQTHYRKPYTCGICGGTINCCNAIKRHELSMHCQLARLKTEQESNETVQSSLV